MKPKSTKKQQERLARVGSSDESLHADVRATFRLALAGPLVDLGEALREQGSTNLAAFLAAVRITLDAASVALWDEPLY